MDKIDELYQELADLRSKYNTRYTRKAVLIALGAGFILGLLVPIIIRMIF